jgi:hypothetical protein
LEAYCAENPESDECRVYEDWALCIVWLGSLLQVYSASISQNWTTCRFEEINLMKKKKIRESLLSASSVNWISLSLTSGYICIWICFQVLNLFLLMVVRVSKWSWRPWNRVCLSITHVLLAIVQRWPPCRTMFSSSSCGIILYSHRSCFMNLFCCLFGELICRFDNGARVCGQVCTQCVNSWSAIPKIGISLAGLERFNIWPSLLKFCCSRYRNFQTRHLMSISSILQGFFLMLKL